MKPIYKPSARAAEYGSLAVNIYEGCSHGCLYCYAPGILRKTREEFLQVKPRAGLVEALRKQLTDEGYTKELIHLCFSCDPYPRGVDTSITREVIQLLKEFGNNVQILTKAGGERACRDFDLLGKNDWFGVTISSNAAMARKYEPYADGPFWRLEALAAAKDKGIKTWVSCEPVLEEEAIYKLIRDYSSDIDQFRIGKLNHEASTCRSDIDWGEFGRTCLKLCAAAKVSCYIKEDLKKEMEKQ
jgi:DNA repair photolyase